MKKTFLRFVSTALATLMLFGSVNLGVFATNTADEQNTVTLTTKAPSVTAQEDDKNTVNASSVMAVARNKTYASVLAGSKVDFNAAEKAVLNAAALKSDSLSYTEPDVSADDFVTLELTAVANTYNVKAETISSGLTNKWTPVGGRAVCAGGDVVFALANGEGTFTAEDIDHVEIDYELVVSEISPDTANFIANLPYVLANEAKEQKAVLDYYARDGIYNRLTDFATYMSVLNLVTFETAAAKAAIEKLVAECIHSTGDGDKLYFAEYIGEYRTKGLAYYYAEGNYENFKYQLETVRDCMNVICADPKFDQLFVALAPIMPDLPEKKGAIEDVKNALNEKTLVPVNANIDRTSVQLPALANAVEAAIDVATEKTVSEVVLAKTTSVVAPDKTTVTITVSLVDRDMELVDQLYTTLTYSIDTVLSSGDIADIEDAIFNMEADLGIDTENYVKTMSGDALPEEGDTIASKLNIEITWAPASYTVVVAGNEQVLYADGSLLSITLPGSGTVEERYIYTIGSEEIPVGVEDREYIFADINTLKALCAGGELIVSREIINATREDLITFVDTMNEALANKATVEVAGKKVPVIAFIPVEDAAGNVSVILRVTPYLTGVDYQALVVDVMKALTIGGNPYDKISINGKTLYDGPIYMQTVLDVVLSDNFGFGAIRDMISASGDIADIKTTEAALAGVTVMETKNEIALNDKLGGKLIAAELTTDNATFPLYITFEDYDQMAETLIKVENAIAQIEDNIVINAENGVLNVELVMPASFSAYYLAELLVMEQAEISNIENMQFEEALAFMMSIVKPLVADPDLTLDVLENTLAKAGQNKNLSAYLTEAQFSTIRKALNYLFTEGELVSESAGTTYSATVTYEIREILQNRFHVDDLFLGLIAEAGVGSKGISLSFTITDNTVEASDFDAIVLNPSARDLGILTTTKDLASALKNPADGSIFVLLQDVTLSSDVVIPKDVIINLNGFTITGNMTANATAQIVDSSFTACGGVNGSVSGNFVITSGHYTTDVSSMLKDGYSVNGDCVQNNIYTISEDSEGNITIALKGGFMNLDNLPTNKDTLTTFVTDVAFDIALNMFTAASMTVDGNNIYSVELNNALGMLKGSMNDIIDDVLGCINLDGINAFANALIAEILDFDALADALDGGKIASYDVQTSGWTVESEIVGDTDKYITLNIAPKADDVKNVTLDVIFDPDMSDTDKAALANLFDGLADTVTINELTLEILDIAIVNKNVTVDIEGAIDVEVNFAEDARYGALIVASVAYASATNRETQIAALEAYLTDGELETLIAELDKVTSADLIKAMKAIGTTTCEEMLSALGIEDSLGIASLEAVYADLLNIASKLVSYIGVQGNATTLGACKEDDAMATYAFSRENVKGFAVDFAITIFDENTNVSPEISIPVVNTSNAKVVGALVEYGILYIDSHHTGVTTAELLSLISVETRYVENLDKTIVKSALTERTDLVCTGDVLKLVADDGELIVRYNIVVLGDTNCNGKNDAGDAVKMARYFVGNEDLGFAGLASDINYNKELDAGDAVKVTGKYIDWNNYTSALD